MMTAGLKVPWGTGVGVRMGVGVRLLYVSGEEAGFNWELMDLRAAWMPLARAVPRWGARRLIAPRMASGSLVGTCTEKPLSLKATTPISTVVGWRLMKSIAAALAASMRVGVRSVAAILPETSKARMTVPS